MNPMQAMANRTARLANEASTPVYSTDSTTARRRLVSTAERAACTEDFCFVCSRCTDHFGEHSEEQLLAWARTPRGRRLMEVRA